MTFIVNLVLEWFVLLKVQKFTAQKITILNDKLQQKKEDRKEKVYCL